MIRSIVKSIPGARSVNRLVWRLRTGFLTGFVREKYLFFWARIVLWRCRPFVIGITGSVGKTTTTEMIAAVLERAEGIIGPIGYSHHGMNDDWTLPLAVLQYHWGWSALRDQAIPATQVLRYKILALWNAPLRAMWFVLRPDRYPKTLVLEFGTHWGGHLDRLARLAPPNIAIVTVIGPAHLDRLKTIEGVVREKSAIVRAVSLRGLVILGQDHDYVAELERAARAPVEKVSGRGSELSENITRAVCRHLQIPDHIVKAALKDFRRPKGRLNFFELGAIKVVDDSYNANPLSMKLGLDTLAEAAAQTKRRLAVLGFMAELGDEAPAYHSEVGAYARSRADVVVGVGELAKHYDPDYWFACSEACSREIERIVCSGDCLLIKGSASARMYVVVDKLKEIAKQWIGQISAG